MCKWTKDKTPHMVGLFRNVFRYFYITIKDLIWPRYQIILISKSKNESIIESSRYRKSKIEKNIKNAIEKYYTT